METNDAQRPVPGGTAPNGRVDQFRGEIAGMDLKTPGDANEQKFLIGAIVTMVVGFVVIVGCWYGASGESEPYVQLPYLISSLLGVGLIIVGCALFMRFSLSRYLRFWLVREIYEQRAQTDRVVESLTSVEDLLRAATRPRS